MRRWEEKEVLIRVWLKLSSFIYKPVDSTMVHSLSHRSKHRKMLLISVCDAKDPLMSVMISLILTNQKSQCCWLVYESYCLKVQQSFILFFVYINIHGPQRIHWRWWPHDFFLQHHGGVDICVQLYNYLIPAIIGWMEILHPWPNTSVWLWGRWPDGDVSTINNCPVRPSLTSQEMFIILLLWKKEMPVCLLFNTMKNCLTIYLVEKWLWNKSDPKKHI